MGIDAEMIVRKVPREHVTDEWLKEASWRLCQAVGADNFYVEAEDRWHKGQPRLALDRTKDSDNRWEPGSRYWSDFMAEDGECLLHVSLWGRYYGPGYERGDLLTYCAVAEWIELNIPGCEVWYGGDSGGAQWEHFTAEKRSEYKRHLFSPEGRAYFGTFDAALSRGDKTRPAACALCPGGIYRGNRNGWGEGYAAFNCPGCGKSIETRDGGETWQEPKKNGAT